MRLTQITIENFKGIRDRVEIPLRPITLLFGANSAGKSTMLQALLYLRELLERQNADADVVSAGGTAIHLGGFRQLVHQHDVTRVIRLGVTVELDDDGLPDYSVIARSDATDDQDPNQLGSNLRTAGVQVSVSWDSDHSTPRISAYTVYGDERIMVTVMPGELGKQRLEVNNQHPSFDRFIDDERRVLLHAEVLEDTQRTLLQMVANAVIPKWKECLKLEIETEGPLDFGGEQDACDALRPVVAGVGEVVLDQLQKIRYIGPVREFPERGALAQRTPSEDRWASGLAAWDWLGRDVDDEAHGVALERFDRWLTAQDGLNLGYSVRLEVARLLPEESELFLLLARLRHASDPEELAEQIRILVESELLSRPRVRRVVMTDVRNGAEVAPQDVGNGVTQVIPVVAGVLAPGGNILAVEQPELHLHPAIQCRLADVFIRALHEQENRLFILETHSEHLMLRLMRRVRETTEDTLAEPDLALRTDQVVVLYAEAGADGLRLTELPLTEDGDFSRNWPGGFFEDRAAEIF